MDFRAIYKRGDYISFFRNYFLPEDFVDHDEDVSLGFKPQFISNAIKIGEVPSLELNIYEVTHHFENDPRVSLSRDAFRLLAQYGVKRALVVFNSETSLNFRFSLVTIDLKWEEGKRVQKEYSNPRRYSFFLGPETKTHTPEEYLIKQGRVKDFEDLKSRFSIEVVNKDFYTQIAVLFTQLAGGKRTIGRKTIDAGKGLLNLPSTVDDTLDKEFTVRLIGRLVFCWFLKKKRSDRNIPLLPEELLSAKAVSEKKGYYHGILESLFFEVLNTPVDNREKKFQDAPWSHIPFLNGGLFTPHDHDFYEPGAMGVSKHINTLKVPDSWIKELFEIFETYNFTIDENTSIDVELSIEPEMLGRIFENLLAEINPETGKTARKATGSYYTPRPIVEYMVDESLKQYLLTNTKLDEIKIKSLLTYEDIAIKLTEPEKESILIALDNVKVIDPACGSGAFPMGILQKMLLVLQKIDPESEWWLERKLSQIESKLLKRELGKKLKTENVNYVHKLGIIQSSIYGVDIQPIAVEISKLRFFLSLIVDEKVNDEQENRGVEPLPNLEFKFVCTNSLIGLPKREMNPDELFETEDTQSINELKDLRDEYLRSYGIEKEKIQIKFLKTQRKMAEFYWKQILRPQTDLYGNEKKMKKQGVPEFTRMLSNWDPFSDEPAGWFDPEWMFGVKDGFDIVIANPPYGALFTKEGKQYLFRTYPILKGQPESYEYFLFIAISEYVKENGVTAYIVPTNFIESKRAEILRDFILSSGLIHVISNFRFNVWENNAAETLIFIHQRNVCGSTRVLHPKSIEEFSKGAGVDVFDQKKWLETPGKRFIVRSDLSFLQKIAKDSILLGAIAEVSQGIIVYKTRKDSRKNLYISNKKEDDSWKKLLDGKSQIEPYRITWGKNYLKYGDWLWCPRDDKFFREPKIIFIRLRNKSLGRKLVGAYDVTGFYNRDNFNNIIQKDREFSLKYILALFNSTLINYWYKSHFDNVNINPEQVRMIPIRKTKEQEKFIKIVDRIISIKNAEDYLNNEEEHIKVVQCEKQIDEMVYSLYGLTRKEIEIIENKVEKK